MAHLQREPTTLCGPLGTVLTGVAVSATELPQQISFPVEKCGRSGGDTEGADER